VQKAVRQNKKVSLRSGGERNRLHLATTLKEKSNVLLFGEPTNDLDVNKLGALEEGLENFAGYAFVVSYNRWFFRPYLYIYFSF
jgi:ATPase subunit of ABC transporter with duplicated ATPase domains